MRRLGRILTYVTMWAGVMGLAGAVAGLAPSWAGSLGVAVVLLGVVCLLGEEGPWDDGGA
jgi:hypothetical protein